MASAAAAAPAGRRVCSVCCQALGPYTCPRCLRAYCSSACYRKHGGHCTEAFYREQATSELKATRANADTMRDMLSILQRLRDAQGGSGSGSGDEASGDESDSCSSSSGGTDEQEVEQDEGARAAGSAVLDALIKQLLRQGDLGDLDELPLTPEVVAELDRLSLAGQLGHLVPPWQPWWTTPAAAELQLSASGQRRLQELGSSGGGGSGSEAVGGLPPAPEQPLPRVAQLTGPNWKPSALLPWQLLQLLAAYCCVMRWYNGEPGAAAPEAAEHLLLLSPPLTQAAIQQAQQQQQQQTRRQVQQAQPQLMQQPPPDSVRCACMQLQVAAAALSSSMAAQPDGADTTPAEQRAAAGATPAAVAAAPGGAISAVPAELRGHLAASEGDALRLLQLGRSATVLALEDARRLLERGRQELKQLLASGKQAAASGQAAAPVTPQQRLLASRLQLALRKLLLFVAWANEAVPPGLFASLALELDAELQERAALQQAAPRSGGSVALRPGGAQDVPAAASAVGRGGAGGGAQQPPAIRELPTPTHTGDGASAPEQTQQQQQQQQLEAAVPIAARLYELD